MFYLRKSFPRGILVLLVIVATVFATGQTVSAGDQVPFEASFTTAFSASVAFPFINITVNGDGQARHLGRTHASTTNQQGHLITGHVTATYTLAAANGDTLVIEMVADSVFPSSTTVIFEGTYEITGGTGRFAGASGSGLLNGNATFTGPAGGIGEFSLSGTVSSPGSARN
jgi:hypothetical protein